MNVPVARGPVTGSNVALALAQTLVPPGAAEDGTAVVASEPPMIVTADPNMAVTAIRRVIRSRIEIFKKRPPQSASPQLRKAYEEAVLRARV